MTEDSSAPDDLLDGPYHDYWLHLGRLIHEFSRVEFFLQYALRQFSGMTPEVSGAVSGEFRVAAAKDAINRVLVAKGDLEIRDRLKGPFDQLGVINGVRNDIVHWGALDDGSVDFLVSNSQRLFAPERLREFRVSLRDLRAMSLDLFRISSHLIDEIRGPVPDEHDEEWAKVRELKWLYRPPAQRTQKKRLPRTPAQTR